MEYLKLLTGDKVILRRHRDLKGKDGYCSKNWDDCMDKYIDKQASVVKFAFNEYCPLTYIPMYKVDIDNQNWHWRISDITILPNLRNINHPYMIAKRQNNMPLGMY